MKRTFVIQGNKVEVDIRSFRGDSELIDVTTVGHGWRDWQDVGEKRVELRGTLPDGEEIEGVFRMVGHLDDGTPILQPWSQLSVVGGEMK